jgi:hypothetical protein
LPANAYRRKNLTLLLVPVFLVLGACGEADDTSGRAQQTPPQEVTTVSIEATDYAFENPPTVQAGAVEFDMTNHGEEEHVMIIARVAEGVTVEEASNALLAPPGPGTPPFSPLFGIAGTEPGHDGNVTGVLEPGTYIIFCPIPSADGTPHLAMGMVSSFEVTGDAAGQLPGGEVSVTGQEFAFVDAPELGAGDHTVSFSNTGEQEHEMNLIELLPGKQVDDVVEFYSAPPGQGGPPPMIRHGGPLLQPGMTATSRFTLEEGKEYAFICAVPDFSDQPPTPHLVKGMFTESFTA